MNTICEVISSLKGLVSLGKVSEEEIQKTADRIGVVFSEEYTSYLAAFGAIAANGIELTGIAKSPYLNVADVTIREREMNAGLPKDMYVVENVGIEGILILQNTKGEIFQLSPHTVPVKIYDSLVEYLSSR